MKRIQFKHIVVGCMLAALLAVPTMAFAAPSADDAAASDPAVVEQQNGVENAGLPEATSGGDNVTADALLTARIRLQRLTTHSPLMETQSMTRKQPMAPMLMLPKMERRTPLSRSPAPTPPCTTTSWAAA